MDQHMLSPPFVGTSRSLLVDGLIEVFKTVKTSGDSSWISLEAPPGCGKTRLVHEMYARLSTTQEDPNYWPSSIEARSRKVTHPTFAHVPDAIPEYLWWGISCYFRDETPTNALRQDFQQLEPHAKHIDDALKTLIPVHRRLSGSLRSTGKAVASEGLLEVFSRVAVDVVGFSTGLGLLVQGGSFAVSRVQKNRERKNRLMSEEILGSDTSTDIVEEAIDLLRGATRYGFPLIIFVEDLHFADAVLIEFITRLLESVRYTMIISSGWPEGITSNDTLIDCMTLKRDRVTRINQETELSKPFSRRASLRPLELDAMSQILRVFFPEVDHRTETLLLKKYTNPWTLQLVCDLPALKEQYPCLSLSDKRIDSLPRRVRELHMEHWKHLPESHKVALAVASVTIPGDISPQESEHYTNWDHPLLEEIIASPLVPKFDAAVVARDVSESTSVHGWVRKIDDYLRAFIEPTQHQVVRDSCDDVLEDYLDDARRTILTHLAATTSVSPGDSNPIHRSRLILSLYAADYGTPPNIVARALEVLLADLHQSSRDLPERLRLFDQFRHISVTAAGRIEPHVSCTIKYYGATVLVEAGREREALEVYRDVLDYQVEIFDETHLDTLDVRHGIATTLTLLGEFDAAISELRSILSERQPTCDVYDLNTFQYRLDIANSLAKSGDTKEAIPEYRKILEDLHRLLHPLLENDAQLTDREYQMGRRATIMCLMGGSLLARALASVGEFEEAILVGREVVSEFEELEELVGEGRLETLVAQDILAYVLGTSGQPDDAVILLERVVEQSSERLDRTHPLTLRFRNSFAWWLFKSSRRRESLEEFTSLIEDYNARLGERHVETLYTRRAKATVSATLGHKPKALAELRALEVEYEDEFGPGHRETLSLRRDLAAAMVISGYSDEGLALIEDVLSAYATAFGEDNRETLKVRSEKGVLYKPAGRYSTAMRVY